MAKGHKDTREFAKLLLSSQREEELDPFTVMTFLPIEPHQHVADIGCGPGFFTIPFAKHLLNGKVYGLDVDEEMLKILRRRVSHVNLGNVEIIKCGVTDFPVATESLDGALLAFVINQNEQRESLMTATWELLKDRGWCGVLEWYRRQTQDGPPLDQRLDPSEIIELAVKVGFECKGWRDINGKQYMVVLRKL